MAYARKMGLDYGDARIGIALTDLLCVICSPHSIIKNTTQEQNVAAIAKLISENMVDTVVIGLPLNMDGTEGVRAEKTRAFGQALQTATKANIVYWDERLSSFEAEDILSETKMNWKQKKEVIDKLAASIILQGWLAANQKKG